MEETQPTDYENIYKTKRVELQKKLKVGRQLLAYMWRDYIFSDEDCDDVTVRPPKKSFKGQCRRPGALFLQLKPAC